MKATAISLVVMTLMVTACSPAAPPAPATTPAAAPAPVASEDGPAGVKKMLDTYTEAWLASDAKKIGTLYSDDAMLLLVNQPILTGRDAAIKDSQDFFDKYKPVAFEAPAEEMKFADGWGWARGIYKDTYVSKANGKSTSDQGKYIIIVVRQPDGSWVMTRDIHDSDGPSKAVTPSSK